MKLLKTAGFGLVCGVILPAVALGQDFNSSTGGVDNSGKTEQPAKDPEEGDQCETTDSWWVDSENHLVWETTRIDCPGESLEFWRLLHSSESHQDSASSEESSAAGSGGEGTGSGAAQDSLPERGLVMQRGLGGESGADGVESSGGFAPSGVSAPRAALRPAWTAGNRAAHRRVGAMSGRTGAFGRPGIGARFARGSVRRGR